jgi:mono/diheme cytochrome c family protein
VALTGYETGLLVVALVFIAFALVVSLVVPRARPEFPGKHLGAFIAVVIALFAAQLTALLVLAEVGEADEPVAHGGESTEPTPTETTPTEPAPTETTPTETTPAETTGETETTDETETTGEAETETETTESQGDTVAGKEIFLANCASCHTLADAGTTGTIGPNLDAASPSADKVVERVTNGQGVMPSFADSLSEQQIQDVAAYVSSAVEG